MMDSEISQQLRLQLATATTMTTNWVGISFSTHCLLVVLRNSKTQQSHEKLVPKQKKIEPEITHTKFQRLRLWNEQANLNAYTTHEIPKTEENKSKRSTFSITARFVAPENQEMFMWKLLDTRKEVALVNKETPGRKDEKTSWNDRICRESKVWKAKS